MTDTLQLPSLLDIEAELARRAQSSLAEFVRQAWPIVEPETELDWNWHHDCICEHLEAVTRGEIRDLLINVPPRHTKSRITSVMWPAWVWTQSPGHQWLCSSYAETLSSRDSQYCRMVIESQWYQRWWGNQVTLRSDGNLKTYYQTTAGGHRIATSVGGSAVGQGGDTLICDDPHNLKTIHSKQIRQTAIDWWNRIMSTRRNDPKKSSRVVIMQRGHHNDLSGDILKRGGYVHINLPAESPKKTKVSINANGQYRDRPEGDLLWPSRFGVEQLDEAKEELGAWAYSAQYQQAPTPLEGAILKTEWWQYYDPAIFADESDAGRAKRPKILKRIHCWDTAFKAKQENDYSVCIHLGMTLTEYYVLNLWRGRLEYPELKRMAVDLYKRDHPDGVLVEDAASGQSLVQDLRRGTNMPVMAVKPDRDKIARAHSVTPTIEAGRVLLPEGAPWLAMFVEECAHFPAAENDDQVDAFVHGMMYLLNTHKPKKAQFNVPYDPAMAATRRF